MRELLLLRLAAPLGASLLCVLALPCSWLVRQLASPVAVGGRAPRTYALLLALDAQPVLAAMQRALEVRALCSSGSSLRGLAGWAESQGWRHEHQNAEEWKRLLVEAFDVSFRHEFVRDWPLVAHCVWKLCDSS